MRVLLSILLVLVPLSAGAQDDAGLMAAQQAQMAAQQAQIAAQQAQQQAQMQAEQATNANMAAMRQAQAAANACCATALAEKPRFSIKPGAYPAGTVVRMKDRTRHAAMYYTTNGWTPTAASTRYTGPITLTRDAVLQAIAVAPGYMPSLVASAVYTVTGGVKIAPSTAAVLANGYPVRLVFTAPVVSKGLRIGDSLPVALDEDVMEGHTLAAQKLAPVNATVTMVDPTGRGGAPGDISFAVHSFRLMNGETVPISGTETMQGQPRIKTAESLFWIPGVGLSALFIHGKEAVIPKGSTLTAYIKDAALAPQTRAEAQPPAPAQAR